MRKNKNYPTKEQALELLKNYKTPPHVINHCKMVSHVAEAMGKALNENGYDLNIELIVGAGLLHDIARVEENHQDVGAGIIEALGYRDMADIIRVHMHYTADPAGVIDETSLVCLADKMILENKYVGIDTRMGEIIKKFSYIEGAERRIREKLILNKEFIKKIERVINKDIDDLILENV